MRKLLPILALLAVAACETDSYDTGTGPYSYTQADFVEAHTDAECAVADVETDDGVRLTLAPKAAAGWINRPDTAYRALLYYNDRGGMSVEPVAISPVPVLTPKAEADFEEVFTDPVRFESAWIGKNGKYANIGMYLKNGAAAGDDKRHTIALIDKGTTVNADRTTTAHVLLYHNQGGVPEYYSSRYYISIACDGMEADSLVIAINTYEGMTERRLSLR